MMNNKKWIEFSKEAVPELERLSSFAKKYGAVCLGIAINTDGYVSLFYIDDDGENYGIIKLYDKEQYYDVKVNEITKCKIPKEQQ